MVCPSDGFSVSLGWMDDAMRTLWSENAHKAVCVEEVNFGFIFFFNSRRLMYMSTWRPFIIIVLD